MAVMKWVYSSVNSDTGVQVIVDVPPYTHEKAWQMIWFNVSKEA